MQNKFTNASLLFLVNNKETLILIFFGIGYRLLLHYFLYNNITILNDSQGYLDLSNKLQSFSLNGYNGERSLGYPILLLLGFNSLKVVVFYQHILGIMTSVFIYKTILNFNFSKKNSLWIVLFMQSFLNIYFYETSILVESLTLFISSIVFYIISINFIDNKSFKLDLIVSFLLGFLTLIKPFYAFIPFLIYGFIILKNFNIKRIISKRIVILLFSLISYFGWSYINKINTGYFTSTTFLGLNLAQNCVYFAEKGPKKYDWISKPYAKQRDIILVKDKNESAAMAIWDAYNNGDYDYKKLKFADLSNQLGSYAVETIQNNPKDYINQVVTKSWLYFWKPTISIDGKEFNSVSKEYLFDKVWLLQRRLCNIFKYGFVLLILFYGYQFIKNRAITNELLFVTIVFATSVLQGLITYGTNARYSFPVEYIIILIGLVFVKNHIKLPRFLNIFLQ